MKVSTKYQILTYLTDLLTEFESLNEILKKHSMSATLTINSNDSTLVIITSECLIHDLQYFLRELEGLE